MLKLIIMGLKNQVRYLSSHLAKNFLLRFFIVWSWKKLGSGTLFSREELSAMGRSRYFSSSSGREFKGKARERLGDRKINY